MRDDLREFYEQAAVRALESQAFRASLSSSGVVLPKDLLEKLKLLDSLGEKEVRIELSNDFPIEIRTLLAKKVDGYPIPKSPGMLALRANELLRRDSIYKAAVKIVNNQNHDEALSLLSYKKIEPVECSSIEDLSSYYVSEFKSLVERGVAKIIVPGFRKLSEAIGGFNPKRVCIFMGETGLGKTNFAVNFSLSAAQVSAVAYVNMEMSFEDMVNRFAVISSSTYKEYYRGGFNENEICFNLKTNHKINITSGKQLSLEQIESFLGLQKKEENIKFAVIDYDQKIDLDLSGNIPEWKSLQNAIIKIEEISKELDINIIVLAQVNRDGMISGSFRSLFPATTVLHFRTHESLGPIIEIKKNRHGKKDQAIKVSYDQDSSRIKEIEVVNLKDFSEEKRVEIKKRPVV